MKSCSAYGCNNRFNRFDGLQFHRFPFGRPDVLKEWVAACRRKHWTPSRWSLLCSDHFTHDDYQRLPGTARNYLRDDAVPSVFNFPARPLKRTVSKANSFNSSFLSIKSESGSDSEEIILVRDIGIQSVVRTSDKCIQHQLTPTVRHVATQFCTSSSKEMDLRKKVKVLQQKLRRKVLQVEALKKFIKPLKNRKDPRTKKIFSIQNDVSRTVTSEVPIYTLQVDLFEQ